MYELILSVFDYLTFIIFILMLSIWFILAILIILVKFFPICICTKLGKHLPPVDGINFDGCTLGGICPRCKKYVIQDSKGIWF